MSDYTQVNANYTARDVLSHGDANKLIKGQYLDQEFGAIVTSIATKYDAGDTLVAATGSAGAPSVTFSGDTDTGMYASATNNIGFATNGLNRLNVDSTGVVGIGAADIAPSLQVQGPANNYTALFQGSLTTGQSFGPTIQAGTNSTDYAITIVNAANTGGLFNVRGDGIVSMNTATVVTGAVTAGAAAALPALPAGYLRMIINGTARFFPFYA